jgi:GNAT superfamily N-acetyltransferase
MPEAVPFASHHVEDAARLLAGAFREARQRQPLIPDRSDIEDYALRQLASMAPWTGFAVTDGGTLTGYLLESFTAEMFMGQPTAFSAGPVAGCVRSGTAERVMPLLYRELSRSWIERGFHAHHVSVFATDSDLISLWFRLGFGMTHFQLFRDLTPPVTDSPAPEVEIRYAASEAEIREIDAVHLSFYPNPPLFWIPHDAVPAGSGPDRVAAGEIEIPLAVVDGRVAGFFILCAGTAEVELFAHPGNAQIKAAYAWPQYRGRGIGRALLAEAVRWARKRGLERLYVEGESANMDGGRFWWRHFNAAEYSLRRCVDSRVNPAMFSEA